MRYLLALAVLTLAGCTEFTAPKPSFDSGNGCNGPEAKAACTGHNPQQAQPIGYDVDKGPK